MTFPAVMMLGVALVSAPPPLRQLKPSDVPRALKPNGTVQRVVGWTDQNGENLVIFSTRDTTGSDKETGEDTRTRQLFVEHVVVGKGKPRQLRLVRDGVEACAMDLDARFIDAALGVTDLDGDGLGEVTFAYVTACRSDVSPLTLKLLMLENGEKYIIRGETRVDVGEGEKLGGKQEVDASLQKGPPLFREHALKVWSAIVEQG
ncbi:MAG: M949_RS01915 family surface polysaccharide biosynthesis protein [Myxococcota bacterium]